MNSSDYALMCEAYAALCNRAFLDASASGSMRDVIQKLGRRLAKPFRSVPPTFDEEWAKKKAEGYDYGEDALEQVRFGFQIAKEALSGIESKCHVKCSAEASAVWSMLRATEEGLSWERCRYLSVMGRVEAAMTKRSLDSVDDCQEILSSISALRAEIAEMKTRASAAPTRMHPPIQSFGIIDPDYARVYTQARVVAWQYGYACLAHGSFTRDLDLLLVPWTAEARGNAKQLVDLIAEGSGLKVQLGHTEKPNGRKAWSLLFPGFGDRRWVDVSVMPLLGGMAE